jgi:hypothetical protein
MDRVSARSLVDLRGVKGPSIRYDGEQVSEMRLFGLGSPAQASTGVGGSFLDELAPYRTDALLCESIPVGGHLAATRDRQ